MRLNNILMTILITNCVLFLLTGCGNAASSPSTPKQRPATEAANEPAAADNEKAAGTSNKSDYLTLAEAKSIVLENAGLAEENVHFVRTQLDTAPETACYDMEFLSESAAYDYSVNAMTGEILSMHCETGSYDLASFSAAGATADLSEAETIPNPEQSKADTSQDPISNPESDTVNARQTDSATPEQQYIGTEAAKLAALDHAGLKSEEVNFVHAHLESDDGIWQYDIEFHKDTTEYDYDIDALTGEVLSFDQDAEYYSHAQAVDAGKEQITQEEAKQLALQHAGVTEKDASNLQVKFDYDDGRGEYEVEWYVGRTEYSCDVDALTGAILSYDKELD